MTQTDVRNDQPLNRFATLNLASQQDQEVNVVRIRSFFAALVMVEQLGRILRGDDQAACVDRMYVDGGTIAAGGAE
jgi:hypothetical protein